MLRLLKNLFCSEDSTLDLNTAAWAVRTGTTLDPNAMVELYDDDLWPVGYGRIGDYADRLIAEDAFEALQQGDWDTPSEDAMFSGLANGPARKTYVGSKEKRVSHYD